MSVLLPLVLALQGLAAPAHVKVAASYVPPAPGGEPAVAVQLTPLAPDIRVNEDPAPRLRLAADQVLVEKPLPRRSPPAAAPGQGRYLDPNLPVTFPVKVGPRAARGEHTVKATVTYFYCSKSEGWCRKGTADVDFPVRVP
ncbi:MAG TPA: hypothetical protein VFO85_12340 [Vicinamibacteria bacterium]|nr:hypothetical protein [Vicinamibacteria bacterium]